MRGAQKSGDTARGQLGVVESRLDTIMGLLLVEGRRREGGGRTAGRTRCVCVCVGVRVYVCVERQLREGGREGGLLASLLLCYMRLVCALLLCYASCMCA